MTKKQKKVLIRIIVSAVLLAAIMIITKLVEINKWIQLVLYLVPYLIIGYWWRSNFNCIKKYY